MDRERVHAVPAQALDEPVGSALGAHEHERAAALAGGELVDQRVELRLVGDRDEAVLDAAPARSLGAAARGGGLRVKAAATRPVAPSSVAEKKSVWRSPGVSADYAVDGGTEAHVEHPVRLVEHQHAHGIESDGAALHEVLEAAGCGHQDVSPSGMLRLTLDARSSVDDRQRQRPSRGDIAQVVGDLARELPRRDEYEGGRPRVLACTRSASGTPKARVLPEPVGDCTSTSCPASTSGTTDRWTSKGAVTPRAARARTTASDTPRSAKDC